MPDTDNTSTAPEELSDPGTTTSPIGDSTEPAPVPNGTPEPEQPDPEPETFPREYVEQLRTEAAEHRTRARDRDEIAQRLHVALTAATGRLADPSDLPFDEAHLTDPDALTAAIDALLAAKPHLATRRPTGDIGQGPRTSPEPVDLAAMLRANAG